MIILPSTRSRGALPSGCSQHVWGLDQWTDNRESVRNECYVGGKPEGCGIWGFKLQGGGFPSQIHLCKGGKTRVFLNGRLRNAARGARRQELHFTDLARPSLSSEAWTPWSAFYPGVIHVVLSLPGTISLEDERLERVRAILQHSCGSGAISDLGVVNSRMANCSMKITPM